MEGGREEKEVGVAEKGGFSEKEGSCAWEEEEGESKE